MPSSILETPEQFVRARTVEAAAADTGEILIAVRTEPAIWFETSVARLREMTRLEANWDSYGAAPVDEVAIQYAYSFLRQISLIQAIEPPLITATPNGQVGLSWDDGQRTMEVEIDSRGRFAYYYELAETEIEKATWDGSEIIALLTRV